MLEYSAIENGSLVAAIVDLNKAARDGWRLDQALRVPVGPSWLWLLIIHRLVLEELEGPEGRSE